MTKNITVKNTYTRKVNGETYQYEAEYNEGAKVIWKSSITHDGDLKGTPGGSILGNVMSGDALKQYIIAYIEGAIERGLGVEQD